MKLDSFTPEQLSDVPPDSQPETAGRPLQSESTDGLFEKSGTNGNDGLRRAFDFVS
jgi:hypothetical protein